MTNCVVISYLVTITQASHGASLLMHKHDATNRNVSIICVTLGSGTAMIVNHMSDAFDCSCILEYVASEGGEIPVSFGV